MLRAFSSAKAAVPTYTRLCMPSRCLCSLITAQSRSLPGQHHFTRRATATATPAYWSHRTLSHILLWRWSDFSTHRSRIPHQTKPNHLQSTPRRINTKHTNKQSNKGHVTSRVEANEHITFEAHQTGNKAIDPTRSYEPRQKKKKRKPLTFRTKKTSKSRPTKLLRRPIGRYACVLPPSRSSHIHMVPSQKKKMIQKTSTQKYVSYVFLEATHYCFRKKRARVKHTHDK